MATEKRLIDANKVLEKADEITFMGFRAEERKQHFIDIVSFILDCATVDAVPVVHARWKTGRYGYECSACKNGYLGLSRTSYCPNCGAKMDGDGNG